MSVVVAVKYNNGVVIAADRQGTKYGQYKESCTKIKRFQDSRIVIGSSGVLDDFLPIQYCDEIIDYKDLFKKTKIDGAYIYENTIPKLIDLLKNRNRVKQNNGKIEIDSNFLLATSDSIFTINSEFGLCEYEFYSSIGCGTFTVDGYLNVELDGKTYESIDKDKAIEIVEDAIQKACSTDIYVGMGIDLFVLEKEE